MDTLSALVEMLLDGYVLCSVLLLAGSLVFRRHRARLASLRTSANALMLVGATWLLAFTVWSLLRMPFSHKWESDALANRISGPYWFLFWGFLACKGVLPQAFWSRRLRRSVWATVMVTSGQLLAGLPFLSLLPRDYLPSSWDLLPQYISMLKPSALFFLVLTLVHYTQRWRQAPSEANQ